MVSNQTNSTLTSEHLELPEVVQRERDNFNSLVVSGHTAPLASILDSRCQMSPWDESGISVAIYADLRMSFDNARSYFDSQNEPSIAFVKTDRDESAVKLEGVIGGFRLTEQSWWKNLRDNPLVNAVAFSNRDEAVKKSHIGLIKPHFRVAGLTFFTKKTSEVVRTIEMGGKEYAKITLDY